MRKHAPHPSCTGHRGPTNRTPGNQLGLRSSVPGASHRERDENVHLQPPLTVSSKAVRGGRGEASVGSCTSTPGTGWVNEVLVEPQRERALYEPHDRKEPEMAIVKTPATEQQLSYLEALWSERLDQDFPRDAIRRRGFADASALIEKLKGMQPLPATEEQLATIHTMDREQGFVRQTPITTRAHANIVLRKNALYRERQAAKANVDATLAALGVDVDSLVERVPADDSDILF